jgi:hypothetical protein
MSEQRALLIRKGLIGTCAFVSLILFVSFYLVVSGAVQRGPRQRLASVDPMTQATAGATAGRSAGHGAALFARVGN